MGTRIKICGIRYLEDASYLNEAMPDYAGFVFWEKSFRFISLSQALALRKRIDARIPCVGVYVDETPEHILEHVRSGAVQIVQLHGHETEAEIQKLREKAGVPVWKAFKIRSQTDLKRAEGCGADQILLDNGYGTGVCFDHELIGDFRREYILAGGLTPDNITDVIEKYHPNMVDLSSGVETDQRKDREKILRVVRRVRAL